MKKIMEGKAAGFYVTLVTMALSLVTALVYVGIYSSSRYMSWQAFGIMLVGIVVTALLIVLKKERFAPAALLTFDFLAFLVFVYYIYFYISSVVTGIQFSGFPLEFFINMALYIASVVLSVVCVFMRQTK